MGISFSNIFHSSSLYSLTNDLYHPNEVITIINYTPGFVEERTVKISLPKNQHTGPPHELCFKGKTYAFSKHENERFMTQIPNSVFGKINLSETFQSTLILENGTRTNLTFTVEAIYP